MKDFLEPSHTTRYGDSVNPVVTDGRDIDSDLATLTGEASGQHSSGASDKHLESFAPTWRNLPSELPSDITYYEKPLLQEPVWQWMISGYYYVGGVTGASLVLSAAAQLSNAPGKETLIKRCHWIGFIGSGISAVLLIADLGRPERFLNMLRVFRPTSPMNMGAWILSGVGATTTAALALTRFGGFLGGVGRFSGLLAGVFGAALATYTGVLVSGSAIPLWQESRRVTPILFGSSAMASLGSAFHMLVKSPDERRLAGAFGLIGQAVEIGSAAVMERQASRVERVGRPFRQGVSGVMWRSAAALSISSAVLTVLPGKSRTKRVMVGVLGTLGSALMRFSIERLGKASALDARASFHLQRAGK